MRCQGHELDMNGFKVRCHSKAIGRIIVQSVDKNGDDTIYISKWLCKREYEKTLLKYQKRAEKDQTTTITKEPYTKPVYGRRIPKIGPA